MGCRLSTAVRVSGGCAKSADAVESEPPFELLPQAAFSFFSEIWNEVGGNHGLDIGREPVASETHDEIVACEVDGYALVNWLPKLRPVLQVPGAGNHPC